MKIMNSHKYLPVFIKKENDFSTEVFKGVEFRISRASISEIQNISIMPITISEARGDIINQCFEQNNYTCNIGICLLSSDDLDQVDLNNIILLTPLVSVDLGKENIIQTFLTKWEKDAIKNILYSSGISKILILTDFGAASKYLQEWKFDITKIKTFEDKIEELIKNDLDAYIFIARNKWKMLQYFFFLWKSYKEASKEIFAENINDERLKKERINNVLGKFPCQNPFVLTTSSFEDWRKPLETRKHLSGICYTYPKLSGNYEEIISEFKKAYGYPPSILSLLSYDATSIAIETIKNGGYSLESFKYLLANIEFKLIVSGITRYSHQGKPLLISKKAEEIFGLKYVDEKGNFKTS